MRFPLSAAALALTLASTSGFAQPYSTKPLPTDKFRQLEELLPTPNEQRTASGAPGHAYWQQRADYVIDVTLDDAKQAITGTATITYHNASPDALAYLWLQLDPNVFAHTSDTRLTSGTPRATPGANPLDKFPYASLDALLLQETYGSDLKIAKVTDVAGAALPHTIVKTMMRVDLPAPLASGAATTFNIAWSYFINNAKLLAMRTGYEYFEKDKNYIYEIAQWFPRMAAYNDTMGWQHKQYLGRGEFTLEFGDYLVRLTVPSDHVVSATGVLQNPEQVLTPAQRDRLKTAETAKSPVFIVTPAEAKAAEAGKPTGTKTWVFKADNVRDFAFASSRKFIWDAMGAPAHASPDPKKPVMAMSFYPNEGERLWSKYSTQAIIQTLDIYSKHTFAYPYPVAQSINGPIGGMEYPMICFNGPRPDEDGTYSKATKYGLISVVIHEVGHNYFPMIVNSDERQWTWMDEGLNSFCQFLAEQAWEKDYPSRRGEPRDLVGYMTGENQVPIMTNSESIAQLGPNAYGKPATALNILRETVMGRELFDYAFKTYAQRWAFKRPYPADFFRTMEDASGIDLDWFWRGWFYTNDHVDISLDAVRQYTLDSRDPAIEKPRTKKEKADRPKTLSSLRNAGSPKRVDTYPELKDFYNDYDDATVLPGDKKKYDELLKSLTKDKVKTDLLKTPRNFYLVDFSNIGGLVMPIILKIDYADGTTEEMRIPAEIWRVDNAKASKLIMTAKEIKGIQVDPHEETADADVENNFWPRRAIKSRFQLFKEPKESTPMKELKDEAEKANKPAEKKSDETK
ncbi:MAG: M1 family metallopeptidase [Undibacterium sp.]|nr:M1 family metallopeptidase [Opitutaceae bacterium]